VLIRFSLINSCDSPCAFVYHVGCVCRQINNKITIKNGTCLQGIVLYDYCHFMTTLLFYFKSDFTKWKLTEGRM
jgi:hypothetical protein